MSKPTAASFADTAYNVAISSTGGNDGHDPTIAYSTMDCQAFVEHCLQAIGIRKTWTGSNAMWRDMAWRGTPAECKKKFGCIPRGAWLYIWTEDTTNCKAKYQKDGQGNAEHVGVYTGKGKGAAHSSSSRKGVCQSVFKGKTIANGGWNRVALSPLLDYGKEIETILANKDTEVIIMENAGTITSDNRAGARLRSKKELKSSTVIRNLPEGTAVEILDNDGTWTQVNANGTIGYVLSEYIKETAGTAAAMAMDDGTISLALSRTTAQSLYNALGAALKGGVG